LIEGAIHSNSAFNQQSSQVTCLSAGLGAQTTGDPVSQTLLISVKVCVHNPL
jgi:hypothetical protein